MSRRRPISLRRQCAEPGCSEWYLGEAETRAEYSRRSRELIGWKCLRHSRPAEVLRPDNAHRRTVIEVVPCDTRAGRTFRSPKGSAFAHGEGWMAWAEDLPVGARIVIDVRLELPAQPPTADDAFAGAGAGPELELWKAVKELQGQGGGES